MFCLMESISIHAKKSYVGELVGVELGDTLGVDEGLSVGVADGGAEGAADGDSDGSSEGVDVGEVVGGGELCRQNHRLPKGTLSIRHEVMTWDGIGG